MYEKTEILSVQISETKHTIQLKFSTYSLFLMSTKSYLKFRAIRDTPQKWVGFGKPLLTSNSEISMHNHSSHFEDTTGNLVQFDCLLVYFSS